MKKILLVGCGAREHIIGEKLKEGSEVELYGVGPYRHPGIAPLSVEFLVAAVDDVAAIVEFAKKWNVDFAVMGPELPLAAGVVDALDAVGIKSASPMKAAAQLETSKGFTRSLLEKYGIDGNPRFRVFENEEGLKEWFAELGEDYVVKADGLMGGKGVKVSGDHLQGIEDGVNYAKECLVDAGRVVVEEKLVGQEFSLLCFVDGKNVVPMPVTQDHKRAFDGDLGPNTGGMGTFSAPGGLLPFLREEDLAEAIEITEKVVDAVYQETGVRYRGVLYGGFMAVRDGVRLIEFNARYGDPEVMNVLTLLASDLVEVCEAMIEGRLDECEVLFRNQATACKYVVPEWYPDGSGEGRDKKIEVVESPANGYWGAKSYLGALTEDDGLKMLGSRAVAFVGVGDTLEEAEQMAEFGAESVKGAVRHRHDIGTTEAVKKKVEMMMKVRA